MQIPLCACDINNLEHKTSFILTCVLPQVLLKVTKMVKMLLTVFTHVHLLLRFLVSRQLLGFKMKSVDVLLQGALSCVGFPAVAAHKWLVQRAQVCFHVLFEVVVQLEAAVTLVALEHVVHLGNLDLDDLDVLQHLRGSHRFLMIHNLLLGTNTYICTQSKILHSYI